MEKAKIITRLLSFQADMDAKKDKIEEALECESVELFPDLGMFVLEILEVPKDGEPYDSFSRDCFYDFLYPATANQLLDLVKEGKSRHWWEKENTGENNGRS